MLKRVSRATARASALLAVAVCAVVLAHARADAGSAEEALAKEILAATGVRGGLVIHLGCGDGRLTAALRAGDSYLVHGLDADAGNVAKARERLGTLGLYGPVSVAQFDGRHLPYAENLANLVVSEAVGQVAAAEILRVLCPGGAAYTKRDGEWTTARKPWPEDIDEWTHFLHDASNDCTARDRQVGPPKRMKWRCGPLWSRSHEYTSSLTQMVSAGGRVFYLFDEGLTGVTPASLPERWALIARDAFNGVLLWKRRIGDLRGDVWRTKSLRGIPPSVPRLLVAEGGRVLTPLGLGSAVSILDAATGQVLATCAGTESAQELRCLDGVLLVRKSKQGIAAFDARTGKKLWDAKDNAQPLTLAAQNGRVFYQMGPRVTCLDLRTGKRLWQTQDVPPAGAEEAAAAATKAGRKRRKLRRPGPSPILVHGDCVLFQGSKGLTAVSAETGTTLWAGKGRMGRQVFLADGKLWEAQGAHIVGTDLKTGRRTADVDASEVFTPGHHPRCYQGKATVRYVITPNRGIEFVSLTGRKHSQHDWARGPCRFGIMPANGLLYVPPDPCFCYPGVKLTGFNALLGPAPPAPTRAPSARIEKGKAYGEAAKLASAGPANDAAWPTYRHDA